MSPAPWVWRLGLLWAAGLNASGWALSALGALNRPAYCGLLVAGLLASFAWWRYELAGRSAPGKMLIYRGWRRWRWRQFLPRGFFGLALLALLGGLLYAPNNIDALAYRTPRVLHWLAEGRWHWINCPYQRLNVRASGFEWLTAPVLALTHSDRALFLLNIASFLALPGLVFSGLREAGIRRRVAWDWMWLFPTGYCFVLQAGGIGNDLYGATVSALAFVFAWRSRRTGKGDDLAWSALGIALATGAKTSNVLLILPWAALVWPAWPSLARRPGITCAVAGLALLASFAPQAWLNWRYADDWTGARKEYAWTTPPSPFAAAVHNFGLFAAQNLLPPINPFANQLNEKIESSLPEAWKRKLDDFAEAGRHAYAVRELPGEEHAGLGAGLTWILAGGAFLGLRQRGWRRWFAVRSNSTAETLALLMPLAAVAGYFVKSAIQPNGRILAPFYLWLLPSVLLLARTQTATGWGERWIQRCVVAVAVLVVVVCPARPLWPAKTSLGHLNEAYPSLSLQRAATVYRIYGARAEALTPLRQIVPASESRIGFITGNEAETSLWKPYGRHRIFHIPPPYGRANLDPLEIRWLVVDLKHLENRTGTSFESWVQAIDGEVMGRKTLQLLASSPPLEYAVVHLRSPGTPPSRP